MVDPASQHRLITTEQMYAVDRQTIDRQTIDGGISEQQLIANAAARVCAEIAARYDKCELLVLVGPGNNGADGREAADLLKNTGWNVTIWIYAKGKKPPHIEKAGLIMDALFGAGLSKPLAGDLLKLVEQINTSSIPVVSVDIPTGIDGDTGKANPVAINAHMTVTFFRKKPGHVLYPGRAHCGAIVCRDINIASETLSNIGGPVLFENHPDLWRSDFPKRRAQSHKYKHGHVLCVSGPLRTTGAARLAARGALRVGAGLVSIAAPASALMVHAAHLTAIMLEKVDSGTDLATLAEDSRKNVILIGPGLGLNERAKEMVEAALSSNAALVLDADALTLYKDAPDVLFRAIKARKAPVILTPHAGEFGRIFGRIFGELKDGSKIDIAREAAQISGAVVTYKGADTVIASPYSANGGVCVVNTNAAAHLATAGSGDVLAGIIAGLLAQGMPALQAACAGVWLHGAAGQYLGPGLIAGDISGALPRLLKQTFYDGVKT